MAGSLKLDGSEFLVKEGGQFKITNSELKLKSSGNTVVDSSGNALISESNGVVTMSDKMVPANSFMFRNKIINGGMKISQRGTSFNLVHDGTNSAYTLDRYKVVLGGLAAYECTVSQYSMSSSELNTTGHSKALKWETTTVETGGITGTKNAYVKQMIEAQSLQDLQYGTASAKSFTLSFYVKTDIVGTYSVFFYKADGTAKSYATTYTTTTTDWEKHTVTVPGNTDSAAGIVDDNGQGLWVLWQIGAGPSYTSGTQNSWANHTNSIFAAGHAQNGVMTTINSKWYLTGVQLEVGPSVTPFEHRPPGIELGLCQRYFQKLEYRSSWGAAGFGRIRSTTSKVITSLTYNHEMRIPPHTITLPTIGNAAGNITFLVGEGYPATHGSLEASYSTETYTSLLFQGFTQLGSEGEVAWAYVSGDPTPAIFKLDAEL